MIFSKQRNVLITALLLLSVIFTGCNNGLVGSGSPVNSDLDVTRSAVSASSSAENTFAVMAPLHMGLSGEMSFSDFETNLAIVAGYGVQAVSVDVWWGDVEKTDNGWDWSYYDSVFEMVTDAGMQIVPIMSFHKCGGGPGDDYTSLIPNWVWNTSGVEGYKDEAGNIYNDYVSHWSESVIINQYEEFMNVFENRYSEYAASGNFMEINISAGPTGELRYPSYNKDIPGGWDWPSRGKLFGYSNLAKADFQNTMINKYGSVNNIQNAWGISLGSLNDVQPPSTVDSFLNDSYSYTNYKNDYLNWYNQALVDHGSLLIDTARAAFNSTAFSKIPLGMKIPGVHWQMTSTTTSRAAELEAGIISPDTSAYNGHGYDTITEMLDSKDNSGNKYDGVDDIILHFTCLEMSDNVSNTSLADTLVNWVADSASSNNVRIKGENALANNINWGTAGWSQIENAYSTKPYEGLTILRIRYKNGEDIIKPITSGGIGQTSYTNIIASYPSAPISPASISASAGNSDVSVSWPQVNGATSYKVYYSTGNSETDLTSSVAYIGSNPSFLHSGLTNNTKYNYKVLALNAAGLSGLSALASATPTGSGAFLTNLGSGTTLTLTGSEFANWTPSNTQYKLTQTADYTWEVQIPNMGSLSNTPYKIVRNSSWTENWGGGASGLNASLSRSGSNATVSLASTTYTLKITEGSSVNDSLNVEWIPGSLPTGLIVHYREWQSASSYFIHTWNGLSGDFQMNYEGEYGSGNHWWDTTLSTVPNTFSFCFKNSNNQWDGVNRHYDKAIHGNEIFLIYGDPTIYLSRP